MLLAFVVFDEQPRNRSAEGLLAGLEGQANLLTRFRIFAVLRQREHAVYGVPELHHRLREIAPLVGRAIRNGEALFEFQAGVQVLVNAFELSSPCGKRIGFIGVQHVAHSQRDGVEVVLDTQQLQRVFPVAIHHLTLKLSQTGELNSDVRSVGQHGGQRDH